MARATKIKVPVRLRCIYDNGRHAYLPGEFMDLPEAEAAFMLKAGLAENVTAPARPASAKSAAKAKGGQTPAPQEQAEGDGGDGTDGDQDAAFEDEEGEAGQ